MQPTMHVPSVAAIDPSFLKEHRIEGIIWDVDGTLMSNHDSSLAPHLKSWFEQLLACSHLRHVILSNSGEDRYRQLGRIFPKVAVLRAYTAPKGILFRRLHKLIDSWSGTELHQRLASGVRVIKKPNSVLIQYGLWEMGLPRESVVLVGDQYITDIAGANLGGIQSIKVPTLGRKSFPFPVQLLQHIEQLTYRILFQVPNKRHKCISP